jgi:hypothetical protein
VREISFLVLRIFGGKFRVKGGIKKTNQKQKQKTNKQTTTKKQKKTKKTPKKPY